MVIYYSLNAYFRVAQFFHNIFFCSKIPSRLPHHIEYSYLLRLHLVMIVYTTFLVFHDLGSFKENWIGFLWNVSPLEFVWCFSHDWSRILCFSKKEHRDKVPFSSHQINVTHIQRYHMTIDVNLDTLT